MRANLRSLISNLPHSFFLLLWPLLILAPLVLQPLSVAMPPNSPFSDLLISHLPNAIFANRSIFYFQQFPLWNSSILNGAPFAADPLSGLWYPPNWLTILFPSPVTFNILLVLHLMLAGWGMYRWAQDDGFDVLPSFLGGIAFAGMPKLIAHLGSGHISTIFAVAWTPFLLNAVSRTTTKPYQQLLITIYFSLIFFADVRWFAYAFTLAVILWLVVNFDLQQIRSGGFRFMLTQFQLICLPIIFFFLITSVSWLPLLEFIQYSSRASLTADQAGVFALPLSSLLGVVIPNLGGFHEWQTYLGVAPLALAIIGAVKTRRNFQTLFFVLIIFFSIWFALGIKFGLFTFISQLPFASLLRVPSRAWFVVGLAVSWLAVRGANSVGQISNSTNLRIQNLLSLALIASLWLLAIGGSLATQKPLVNFIGAAIIITSILVVLRLKNSLNYLLLITIFELLWVNFSLYEVKPIQPSPVAQWLSQQSGLWRVYSPSYSLPQNEAARFNLQQADGVNPMQITDMLRYMQQASGVLCKGYSVTTPCFESDNEKDTVATINKNAIPNMKLLGDLNVRYIVSEFDLQNDGLVKREQFGTTRVYENTLDTGRVHGGKIISWTPNRIVVESQTDRVALAEIGYPGWVAWVDGITVEVGRDGIFRAVNVGAGSHQIIFEFHPMSVYIGMTLSVMGVIGLMLYTLYTVRRATQL